MVSSIYPHLSSPEGMGPFKHHALIVFSCVSHYPNPSLAGTEQNTPLAVNLRGSTQDAMCRGIFLRPSKKGAVHFYVC